MKRHQNRLQMFLSKLQSIEWGTVIKTVQAVETIIDDEYCELLTLSGTRSIEPVISFLQEAINEVRFLPCFAAQDFAARALRSKISALQAQQIFRRFQSSTVLHASSHLK
jgi:hypothetical protein